MFRKRSKRFEHNMRTGDGAEATEDEKRGRRRCIRDLINLFPSLCSVLDLGIQLYIRSSHCRIHRSANTVPYVYMIVARDPLICIPGTVTRFTATFSRERLHPLNRLTPNSGGLTHEKRMVRLNFKLYVIYTINIIE